MKASGSLRARGYQQPAIWALAFAVYSSALIYALTPADLRCQFRHNPMGLDTPNPYFTWVLLPDPNKRGQRQTAYQILVASSPELLKQDRADLWDTGMIPSDETLYIRYNGIPLKSNQRCYWKVRVWDQDGNISPWSNIAFFSIGLLSSADWKAQWIGFDEPRQPKDVEPALQGASWIWFAGDKQSSKPKAVRYFARDFTLPEFTKINSAILRITADDRLALYVNGRLVGRTDGQDAWRIVRQFDLANLLRPGLNLIRVQVENTSEGPAGLIAKLTVELEDGKTFEISTDSSWLAAPQAEQDWITKPASGDLWSQTLVLGPFGMQPWGNLRSQTLHVPPAVYLRKEFQLAGQIEHATLYATALGWYDVYINGRRVNESYFNPGWTDYRKRVYYRAFDVTDMVKEGANAIGAILSDGWYSGYIGWNRQREHYGSKPRFLAQLIVCFRDGSQQVISTGPDWKASTGPIVAADILMGETYDARLELKGWAEPNFNDANWKRVDVGAELHPVLQAHPGPEVKIVGTFKPQKITQPQKGVYVFDLGQNFAGVVQIKVHGQSGQKIQIRHAERLNPDGSIYTANLRSARATDVYICKGEGEEVWSPRFTFHGFQYVEITGLTEPPTEDTVLGLALSSDTPIVGEFECSDWMLNRLHKNIFWTQRANFIDVPTDCPQRDERLGWTGDAQVYIRTASLNTDVHAFFRKWLVDLLDAQRADGQFPMVAPLVVAGDDGGPAWADAGVVCPWTIYEVYGDRELLQKCYPAMKRFVEFCKNRCQAGLIPPASFHCFGDWLNIKDPTPNEVIYMAYFAYSTFLTSKAAEVLGLESDAKTYRQLYQQICDSFAQHYVKPDGRILGDSQTAYVLALAFDLVKDQNLRGLIAKRLVEKIKERDWHLSTGFIGTKDLMLVLDKIGRNDVAYKLIHNDTFPSWGFSIKHGATTIWERWDGWTPENGFQDPGMNSFAHYSFGAVYQWMVQTICGIRNASPTYRQIEIKPYPDGQLTWARVSYASPRGLIQTHWRREGDLLQLQVTVPPNTQAIVFIPTSDPGSVCESGKPLTQYSPASEITVLRQTEDCLAPTIQCVVVKIGSGTYEFTSKFKPAPMPGSQ